jgi:NitT/TauT family transport system substrate-binding protein
MTREINRPHWRWGAAFAAVLLMATSVAARADDLPKVKIAVGGAGCLCYLPTLLAEQLGLYKQAGLSVELQNFKGGSQAATAVLGGSADVVSGFYDHTVDLQPKGKFMQAIVVFDRFPGYVLAVAPKEGTNIKSVKDLVGKTAGVTAPGSSTDFFLKYMLRKAGVDPASVSVVGIGNDATAVAALDQGQVSAGVVLDPVPTVLKAKYPNLVILADARTEADTLKVFGGAYPAGVLYAQAEWVEKHQKESQALAEAIVGTLQWIQKHTAEEVMAKMPDEQVGPDKALYLAALKNTIPMYSLDGRMDPKGAQAVLDVFTASVPEIANAHVDITKTYTNKFAEAAGKKLGLTN